MKVKDVISAALNILGRAELAKAVSDGAALGEEGEETVNTLLYCFNSVEDELARKYIPLTFKERLSSNDGKYRFVVFVHTPVKINKVYSGGKQISFSVEPQYLVADAKEIEVEYDYCPKRKKLEDTSDYGAEVGEYVLATGAAAEYCLINGEAEAYGKWEEKYREAIDVKQKKLPVCASIPPRRWI